MATYLNGEQFWHTVMRRPPDGGAVETLLHRLQSSEPPKTAASERFKSVPHISKSDMGSKADARALLNQRREQLLQQQARIEVLLKGPERPRVESKARQERPAVPPRPKSAPLPRAPNSGSQPTPRGGQWRVAATNDSLPTFMSHGVWSSMRYKGFDAKGLVPKRNGMW